MLQACCAGTMFRNFDNGGGAVGNPVSVVEREVVLLVWSELTCSYNK